MKLMIGCVIGFIAGAIFTGIVIAVFASEGRNGKGISNEERDRVLHR